MPESGAVAAFQNARVDSRRRHVRTPLRSPRMLIASQSEASGASLRTVRVDVPERLLRMTRFGLDFASDESGWWRRVEAEMQRLVDLHLPVRARDVEMHLDVDRLEVVLRYALPEVKPAPIRCA